MLVRCTRCLYWSNHPLGITFDEDGVCSGCQVHDEKNQLDWIQRGREIQEIFDSVTGHSKYDCVIPVSGGQDSFFTVHYAIHVLGLNPLLVNFNRIFNSSQGLRNLAVLRSSFDADFRQFSMSEKTTKAVLNTTLSNLGSLNWLSIAGQTSLPVRIAIKLQIPFVLWGAHQGIEQVGMYSHLENVEMTRRYRREHDLMGYDEQKIFDFNPNFDSEDIASLHYPTDSDLIKSGVRGIYLSNYVRWDPTSQHIQMNRMYGYGGRKTSRAFSFFDNPDCPAYFGLQDILKQTKFGYSKATDQLTREVRHGRISRDFALSKEKKLINAKPDGVRQFADWMGITMQTVNTILLQHSTQFAAQILEGSWNSQNYGENTFKKGRSYWSREKFQDADYEICGKGI